MILSLALNWIAWFGALVQLADGVLLDVLSTEHIDALELLGEVEPAGQTRDTGSGSSLILGSPV